MVSDDDWKWIHVLKVAVFCSLLSMLGYMAAWSFNNVSNKIDAELKYWRLTHPEEYQRAVKHDFKIVSDACLECWK